MIRAFGSYGCIPWPAQLKPDPSKPDPRARNEMAEFAALPPEIRQAIANSRFGQAVAPIAKNVRKYGPCQPVRIALRDKGVFPCDIGTEGVILESVLVGDELESQRLRAELDV